MPSITIPVLNNLPAFQAIIQGENVSEAKKVLIETVTKMSSSRWKLGYLVSSCRIMKREAESVLLTALFASSSMDEIKQALRNYNQRLNGAQYRIHSKGNTSAFMKGISHLIRQSFSLESEAEVYDKSTKLSAREPEVFQQESGQDSDKNPQLSGISMAPCSPAHIPASIRTDIINAMGKAGYSSYEEGMCYGMAWTALSACVRLGGQAYMKRMQYLNQMDTPPLPGTDDKHQVYPFFDAVMLSMTYYRVMTGYEKGIGYPGRQEIAFPGSIIGGHERSYQVPVVKYKFIAECTVDTFIRFLQQTRKNNKETPFGVMIQYPCHSTSVGFDGNRWLATNYNRHYYTENTGLLYTFLCGQSDYYKGGKIIAAMEVVADNEHSLNINDNILVVDTKKSVCVPLILHLALQSGDVNVITDCITVIGQQTPTPETLFRLLTCKNTRSIPGFFMALHNGHSEAISAFISASAAVIAALPLSEERKAKLLYQLLASKAANGMPGFFVTLQNNHSGAIKTFIQTSAVAIVALPLLEAQKYKLLCMLLASETADGTPGFYMALQNGHPEAITAFIQASAAVITTFSESEEEKAESLYRLLASKRADGTPGFFMALHNGHSEAITAFIQASAAAFDSLSLSKAEKAKWLCELLVSNAADDTPGFCVSLYHGHTDAITAFIQASAAAIATLAKSEEEKTELLYRLFYRMKNDNKSNFLIALKKSTRNVQSIY